MDKASQAITIEGRVLDRVLSMSYYKELTYSCHHLDSDPGSVRTDWRLRHEVCAESWQRDLKFWRSPRRGNSLFTCGLESNTGFTLKAVSGQYIEDLWWDLSGPLVIHSRTLSVPETKDHRCTRSRRFSGPTSLRAGGCSSRVDQDDPDTSVSGPPGSMGPDWCLLFDYRRLRTDVQVLCRNVYKGGLLLPCPLLFPLLPVFSYIIFF